MDKKEKAKQVKIETLYKESMHPFGDKLRGRCPFHEDSKNPNFFIYTKTNSWYCFAGCGGGDAISFYMKLHNVDFKQAIKEMV